MSKYGWMQPRHSKGEDAGEESVRECGMDMCTFKMDSQQGPIAQHMKLC